MHITSPRSLVLDLLVRHPRVNRRAYVITLFRMPLSQKQDTATSTRSQQEASRAQASRSATRGVSHPRAPQGAPREKAKSRSRLESLFPVLSPERRELFPLIPPFAFTSRGDP